MSYDCFHVWGCMDVLSCIVVHPSSCPVVAQLLMDSARFTSCPTAPRSAVAHFLPTARSYPEIHWRQTLCACAAYRRAYGAAAALSFFETLKPGTEKLLACSALWVGTYALARCAEHSLCLMTCGLA